MSVWPLGLAYCTGGYRSVRRKYVYIITLSVFWSARNGGALIIWMVHQISLGDLNTPPPRISERMHLQ